MKRLVAHMTVLLVATKLAACGMLELKNAQEAEANSTETICTLPTPKTCPDILYTAPIPKSPDTLSFNLANERVSMNSEEYISNGDIIYSFPSGQSVNAHEANAKLLATEQHLYAVGKYSITVYDISTSETLNKITQVSVRDEISGARVIGNSLVVISTTSIGSIYHPAKYFNRCKTIPAYTENIYQTKITRMALENLEDDESIELIGAVQSEVSNEEVRFLEPGPTGSSIMRIVTILPNGQLGQLRVDNE
jgi:hypothetical protein